MDRLWIFCLVFGIILDHSKISAIHAILAFNSHMNNSAIPNSIGEECTDDPARSAAALSCSYYAAAANAKFKIETYPVMYKGEALYGWFNVKITKADPNDQSDVAMRWSMGQGQLVKRYTSPQEPMVPGEFLLSQFDEQNAPSCFTNYEPRGKWAKLEKKHFIPALFAPDPYPTVPYAFMFPASKVDKDGPTALTLNWRLNFPFCGIFNSERALTFHVYISVFSSGCDLQYPQTQDVTFQEYASGAHDPAPPKQAKVDCSKSLGELRKEDKLPKWISNVSEIYIKTGEQFNVFSACSLIANKIRNAPAYVGQEFFGRCQFYQATEPIPSKPYDIGYEKQHYCASLDNAFWIDLPEQGEIIVNNTNTVVENCTEICNDLTKGIKDNGISANSGIGKRVFSYRRGHGLFMIIGTIFFMTVSHFGAHFYKETFFNKRILNFHIWYTIHVNGSLMALLAFFVGIFAGIAARLFFGYSRHITGLLHVVLGWISIAIFVLVFISSGIRMRSPKPRAVTIFVHYLGGGLSYLLNILCLASSCFIPASPSGRNDIHIHGFKFELHFLVPLIAWIIFDLLISMAMNICMLRSDKKMRFKKKRKWACFPVCGVAIPMLRPYSKKDLEGTKIRKILLLVYFLVAALLTIALVVVEMTSPTDGRFFGPMKYTHEAIGKLRPKFEEAYYIDDADSD